MEDFVESFRRVEKCLALAKYATVNILTGEAAPSFVAVGIANYSNVRWPVLFEALLQASKNHPMTVRSKVWIRVPNFSIGSESPRPF